MLQSSARLLRLITLLQSRPTWTGPELTSRLGVTARTLRRDVDRLRSLGHPVDSTTGPAGGYKLGAGASLPPLMLDNDEGLAVAVALHGAATDVAGIDEAGQRALAKLEQVLPKRLRTRLGALRASIVRLSSQQREPRVALGVVDQLAAACADRRVVELGYRDGQGKSSRRALEPQRLVLSDRRWYLVAWDRGREDWRTFRVDRIEEPLTAGAAFTPHPVPAGDVTDLVTRARSFRHHALQARVVFEAPLPVLRAKIPPAFGELTAMGPERCRLETGGSTLGDIAMWLGWTGVPFTVETPRELGAHLVALGTRLIAAAGATGARAGKSRVKRR